MRIKVGNTSHEVEVGQYKEINKGSLKATFALIIYPEGQKILDCKYFMKEDRSWFSFPQKEVKYSDGRETDYIPLVSYLNKEYLELLKSAVLQALTSTKPQVNHVKYNQSSQGKANSVPSEAPFDWQGTSPF